MSKQAKTAAGILECIGGKENVTNVFHCMTRLRFNVKDMSLVDVDAVKKVDGVIGAKVSAGELQVIIGGGVDTVYQEVLAVVGLDAQAAIDENLDPELTKLKAEKVNILDRIIKAFSASMSPIVPLFVAIGIFNMIAVLIGPTFFKLVAADSDLYNNFYFVGQAILYFLPVLVGYTAARHFGATRLITVAIAGFLLFPSFTALIDAGTAYTMFGISVPAMSYNGTILPMMLIAWVQSYVEKLLNKAIPDMLKVIFVPCGTILVMLPLAFCVLGPAGYYVGSGIGAAIYWLYGVAGPVATMLLGAFSVINMTTGVMRPVFFIAMTTLFANGVEFVLMPNSMCYINWVVMGCMVGYFIKTKDAKNRQLAATCFGSNFLGGVSEPSIFGVIINNKRIIAASMIGGALSGLYSGIMKVGYYSFGPSNFLNVIGFMNTENPSNFVHGCIAAGIAFVSATVATILLYRDEQAK